MPCDWTPHGVSKTRRQGAKCSSAGQVDPIACSGSSVLASRYPFTRKGSMTQGASLSSTTL